MTAPNSLFESYYPIEWVDSVHSSRLPLVFPLHDGVNFGAESVRKMFAPYAGFLYVYRPSRRRRVLNRSVDKLEESALPGYEYAISHLYDKYRRNLTISTISQTGQTISAFLSFFQTLGKGGIEDITRKDIAAYVEHEQERGLKINSVKNHLHTVYAFIQYLVDNEVLPLDILHKKIRNKNPPPEGVVLS